MIVGADTKETAANIRFALFKKIRPFLWELKSICFYYAPGGCRKNYGSLQYCVSDYYATAAAALVYNDSEVETGIEIDIYVLTDFDEIIIRNTETGESLTLQNEFLVNDQIIINTNKGEKSIQLIRNGVTSNLMGSLVLGSVFFQLAAGDNTFGYIVNGSTEYNDYATVQFKFYNKYGGV